MPYRNKTKHHTCLNCGIVFSKPHNPQRPYKFCSHKCNSGFLSKKARIIKECKYCGKAFSVGQYYKKQGCCSPECANHYKDRGKTSAAIRIRESKEYAIWRAAVFMRDGYGCQVCGQKGEKLNADHIKPFSTHPELRLAIDNGRTLCVKCHLKTDTFGNRIKRNSGDYVISQVNNLWPLHLLY